MSAFQEAVNKANPEQRAGIERIDGPVLVIAGPGTGKTQILSLRIGNILNVTDTDPSGILCLTYTEAGAVEMRKRLAKLINPQVAYRIHIHTFHSFCNAVINENREYFGGTFELQAISELETVELYYKLIDNFPADNCLKKYTGDVYSNLPRLKALFDYIKKENIDPNLLMQKADDYIAGLPENPDYQYKKANAAKGIKVGDRKMSAINAEVEKMDSLKAALCEFQNYQRLLAEAQRYDFNDMINWVIEAFKKHEGLLAKYQERYLYFLVDEFQDTNGAQIEILNLLTAFWEAPNLFAVGDDDQSIYSFQGAENERIKEFVRKYADHLYPVVLTTNYRSTQQVLDLSSSLIENNVSRLTNDLLLKSIFLQQNRKFHKNLKAHNTEKGNFAITEYFNAYHEAADIVEQVEQKFKAGENLGNTAIIYRAHKQVEAITKAFEHRKIPYNARFKVDILKLPFIQKIINILEYVHLEANRIDSGEHLLFEIMHYDFFKISARDIFIITREAYKSKLPWKKIISDKGLMFRIGLETASAISELEDLLVYWQKQLPNTTLQVLLEKIVSKGGITKYIMESDEKIWLLQVLTSFFNFIKGESAKNPSLNVGSLLQMLRKMEKNKIKIELDKIMYAENGVNLITAHSSKGLEFKTVYIIACSSDNWEKKKGNNNDFKIPPDADLPVEKEIEKARLIEEERRLFYVAMTRAKENLFISYSGMKITDVDKEKSTLEKSQFVAELIEKNELEVKYVHKSDEQIFEFGLQSITASPAPEVKAIEKAYVDEVLKTYRLSVTHLNKYLKCKLSFYFENVLCVPTARTASMGFGSVIHYALEKLFKKMQEHPKKEFPSKDAFVSYYKEAMDIYASHFTHEEFKLRIEYGDQLLPAYYDFYINQWHKVVVTEYRAVNVVWDNVPLSGALDKLEFDGTAVNVVDYKTGNPDKAKAKLKRPKKDANNDNDKFEDVFGGDYWRQIVFYKLIMDNDKSKKWEMISGEIDFVQQTKAGTFEKEKVYVSPEDLEIVKKQVRTSYDGIMAHDFYTGCGKSDCSWCNFVKENYKGELISEEEESGNNDF